MSATSQDSTTDTEDTMNGTAGDGSGSTAGATGESTVENGDGEIPHDDCFHLLSNHRRRYALHYLQQQDDGVTLGELADQVAAWENDADVDAVSYDERKRVYTSLQQVHLPRMDDFDVVEFDDREGRVRMGAAAEHLDVYLEIVTGNDIPWSTFYLSLVAVNAGLLGGAMLGLPVLSAVPGIGWAAFAVTTFLVTSLAHVYLARTKMRLGETDAPPETQT
jgi:hypothetical protein